MFILVYFQVFFSDYAYLDEIHQLWHNDDDSNFLMFHTQGRWLTGLLFKNFFSSISTIAQLKYLRVFSLTGWLLTTFIWGYFSRKWFQLLDLRQELWWLSIVYFVCGISVCVYIGWASCMEVFLAVAVGLLSTNILFTYLAEQKKEPYRSVMVVLGSLFFGIVSLFIYQPSFGVFLIPFFLRYIMRRKARPDSIFTTGLIFYFLIYVVYYFCFKYSLREYHIEASNRTEIHFDVLKKISFFFSGPFPQGFSMNLLFYAGSIFSQAFYVFIFLMWLIITFKRNSPERFTGKIFFVAFILVLLAMVYLPSMIAAENFPSYRTLFVFNLAVFLMVAESLVSLIKKERARKVFLVAGIAWVLITGFYAFNFQYINPLKKEYFVLKNFFREKYNPSVTQVYFIRADKFLFSPEFHTRVYRDELGAPSTYRDWVPEPIVRQMIFELTGERKIAEETKIEQFENA
ncbi:MAG TPA: hypothetical protein VGQ53_20380, partial [Chitinophagaceae bacterium]|nr:hypothetical protein [Chitinophagaceae bacterium]